MNFRLYKKEKLCSATAIEALFSRGADVRSALVFPLRAVWRSNPGRRSDAPIQFMISVPKKKLRHAVDRVAMRRRIREAFRLLHHAHIPADGARIDVVFVYIDNTLRPFSQIERAMGRLLAKIAAPQATAASDVPQP